MKKTKIIATLGPTTEDKNSILRLAESGMNVARLNFSHGTRDGQIARIEKIREIEKELNQPIAILQDLQGPKIRLGNLREDSIPVQKNQRITLKFGDNQTDDDVPVQINIFPFLKEKDKVLINDGNLILEVEEVLDKKAVCVVMNNGELNPHKGVNVPDTILPNVALTEKDKKDLQVGLDHKVDYVALSFVQSAEDIKNLRNIIAEHRHHPKIIAKIETKAAVKNLKEIIREADSVMIARGDMAIEVGQEEVPIIQRKIISLCREFNKPVIIATQMLESMIHSPQPTRAEVNDVATAVMDLADCIMLSAETAKGNYPLEAVQMMNKIIMRVEKYEEESNITHAFEMNIEETTNQTTAVAAAATLLAQNLHAKMIFSLTSTGRTAFKLSLYRSSIPIISATDDKSVYRQLALVYGITPMYVDTITNNKKVYKDLEQLMVSKSYIRQGDRVVMVTGTNPGHEGHTNSIEVTQVL